MEEKQEKMSQESLERVCDSSITLLRGVNLAETSANCGGSQPESNKLAIRYYSRDVIIDIPSARLYYTNDESKVDISTCAVILHYIITADGEPSTGKWISFRELPDGLFYSRTVPEVLEPLLASYGGSFDTLAFRAGQLGGIRSLDYRNGVILKPFPYFPVMLVLEEKTGESDPAVRVLFDSSASHYMNTDMIKLLLVQMVSLLIR